MKSFRITLLALLVTVLPFVVEAQRANMQYYRLPNQLGRDQFEAPKETDNVFDEVEVRIGGGLALQFQGLSHENANANDTLADLGSNFNLATANLDLDVQIYSGVRMHLRTYLSSRNHAEAWVKGGYLQIDRLDFISDGFASGLMDNLRFKVGHMEINYGDAHFRRTDNGMAVYNPFVGNYLFDSFTTEVAGEVYYFGDGGLLAMVGISNGRLNQSVTNTETTPSFYAKLGYDNEFSEDFRFRLTGSVYSSKNSNSNYLYDGDRAGARYYGVMDLINSGDNFRSGRIDPDMDQDITSIMINPFIEAGGFELFGVAEFVSGYDNRGETGDVNRNWTHLGIEALYKFGEEGDVYIGGRYNNVAGEMKDGTEVSVNRINLGGGWFMTKNVLAKLEYVSQSYNDYPTGTSLDGGKFNGVVLEAAISF